jgi:hypothetical protein
MPADVSGSQRSRTTTIPRRAVWARSRRAGVTACACPPRSRTSCRPVIASTSRSGRGVWSTGSYSKTSGRLAWRSNPVERANGSLGAGSRSRPAQSARRRSSCARASGHRPRCSTWASSPWWTFRASARVSSITPCPAAGRATVGQLRPADPARAGGRARHGAHRTPHSERGAGELTGARPERQHRRRPDPTVPRLSSGTGTRSVWAADCQGPIHSSKCEDARDDWSPDSKDR